MFCTIPLDEDTRAKIHDYAQRLGVPFTEAAYVAMNYSAGLLDGNAAQRKDFLRVRPWPKNAKMSNTDLSFVLTPGSPFDDSVFKLSSELKVDPPVTCVALIWNLALWFANGDGRLQEFVESMQDQRGEADGAV